MKLIAFCIILAFGLFFSPGCDVGTNADSSQSFVYTGYDSSGIKIITGTLTFFFNDSITYSGTWQLRQIGNPSKIGPQTGSGDFVGGVTDSLVWVNLNPNYADNNVHLSGKLENESYTGTWQYVSFIGVTNQGTFIALAQ